MTSRRIVGRYLVASTAILLVSGLLGVLIRESHAGIGRLDANTWYAPQIDAVAKYVASAAGK